MALLFSDLTFRVRGAAMEVHRRLGPGFPERLYEEAMAIELTEKNLDFERQEGVDIEYQEKKIGAYMMDMVVDRRVVLEFKACSEINRAIHAQAMSYLAASGLRLALIINFGQASLQVKRVV
jgi:GxxExxY protein